MSKKCNKCGAEMADDALFCGECGAKLKASERVCFKCGAPLEDDALFCGECGARQSEAPRECACCGAELRPAAEEAGRKKVTEKAKKAKKAVAAAARKDDAARKKAAEESEKAEEQAEKEKPSMPQAEELPYVDLGLSVKWARCNLGARRPEEKGTPYAWGETKAKDRYEWATYAFGNDAPFAKYQRERKTLVKKHLFIADEYRTDGDGKSRLEKADDAARKEMKGKWRIPTKDELDELKSRRNCQWTWSTMEGVDGYVVRSKKKGFTDNWIFLPVTGIISCCDYKHADWGCYWSSDLADYYDTEAWNMKFTVKGVSVLEMGGRFIGRFIRPVTD